MIGREFCIFYKIRIRFSGDIYHYYEVSVNFNVEN